MRTSPPASDRKLGARHTLQQSAPRWVRTRSAVLNFQRHRLPVTKQQLKFKLPVPNYRSGNLPARLPHLALVLLVPFLLGAADSQERIKRFSSDIIVYPDGSLQIKEKIKVRAEGNEIKRGIQRKLSTSSAHVFKVVRNGQKTPHRVELQGERKVVEIRQKNPLKPGVYTYTLTYATKGQLASFGNYKQFSWDVIGQDWPFPVEKVRAEVHLPDQVPDDSIRFNASTGYSGEKGLSYDAQLTEKGTVSFSATRLLMPREGLRVMVAFPKGSLNGEQRGWLNSSLMFSVLSLLVIISVMTFLIFFLVKRVSNSRSNRQDDKAGGSSATREGGSGNA
ncbi:MAG: hypothetical protein BRC44_17255 [Cyanobacteria bacterium QS_4_48_99]|nr:MAG: hypothetical protein BRC44_17255 [Cyanobacteria bacterium QS_4_48_99]